MKTMKLSELLKKITPLEWRAQKLFPDGDIIKREGWEIVTRAYDVCANIPQRPPIRNENDAIYIAHAANVLPELVEVANKLTSSASGYGSVGVLVSPELLRDLKIELARAEEVKVQP